MSTSSSVAGLLLLLLLCLLPASPFSPPAFSPGSFRQSSAFSFPSRPAPRSRGPRSRSSILALPEFKQSTDIDDLFAANAAWVASKEAINPAFFSDLGAGHNPKYLWIGCSDARVPANEIIGEDAGSVFVLRNVANQVCSTDFNVMSALQYVSWGRRGGRGGGER